MESAEDLDPRVQLELEKMNAASEEINKLQNELDEARNHFRCTLTAYTQRLEDLSKKNKKSIQRSKTYYEAKSAAKKAQGDAQRAAVMFRRSSSMYLAAKETVELAEKRLKEEDVQFDEAWQEMLNHNIMKMKESEKEKVNSDLEHHRKSSVYMKAEQTVVEAEKKQKRSIARSRAYYELQAELEMHLEQQKQNVDDLQTAISEANTRYKGAMSALESISESIHSQRKRHSSMPVASAGQPRHPLSTSFSLDTVREPGVGCEATGTAAETLGDEMAQQIQSLRARKGTRGEAEEDFSSDVDSVYSFDTSLSRPSMSGATSSCSASRPDIMSLLSESDSAIHSPKSGTLERGGALLENFGESSQPAHCPLTQASAGDPASRKDSTEESHSAASLSSAESDGDAGVTGSKRPLSRNVSGASLRDKRAEKRERKLAVGPTSQPFNPSERTNSSEEQVTPRADPCGDDVTTPRNPTCDGAPIEQAVTSVPSAQSAAPRAGRSKPRSESVGASGLKSLILDPSKLYNST